MVNQWPPRRQVHLYQIDNQGRIFAFCNDGSIWVRSSYEGLQPLGWKMLSDDCIPDPGQTVTPIEGDADAVQK